MRSLVKLFAAASILAGLAALIREILDRWEKSPTPVDASEGATGAAPATRQAEPHAR